MSPDPLSYNMSDVNPHLTRCEPPPYIKAESAPGSVVVLTVSPVHHTENELQTPLKSTATF